MINTNKLKGKIIESGLTVEEVALALGINRATMYRKINTQNFTVPEANLIVKLLRLSVEDATAIFFANYVA